MVGRIVKILDMEYEMIKPDDGKYLLAALFVLCFFLAFYDKV